MKVTVLSDNNGKKYLLDTGGSNLFLDNAGKLGIDISEEKRNHGLGAAVLKLLLAAVCLLTIASCSKGGQDSALLSSSIRQIDITEVVPIHSSSLEYFDFVFKYSDNLGKEEEHTIRDDSSLSNGCYVKTYSYRGIPVACRASVKLVPKVPGTYGTTFFTHTMILDSADGCIEYFSINL